MAKPTYYPKANRTAQNFVNNYPGVAISANVLVIHTTETTGWPAYKNGAVAPHLSMRVFTDAKGKLTKSEIRQHFPFNRSARALKNLSGGVQTNNSSQGVIQIELLGTSGWNKKNKPDWSDPDVVRLVAEPLIEFLVFCNLELNIPLSAPYAFTAWNKSPRRMTFAQWASFKGICGHQHVPENIHTDPGALDIGYLINEARKRVENINPKPVPNPNPTPPDNNFKPLIIPVTKKFDKATIKLLQYALGLRGNQLDSVYGPVTKKALQKWLFVKQDGVVGPLTVKALQKRVGLKGSRVDGKWGPQTNEYLQNYLNKRVKEGSIK